MFVVNSRTGFLVNDDIVQCVTPKNPANQMPDHGLLCQLHLCPFNSTQIDDFVVKFADKFHPIFHVNASQYREALQRLPQVAEFTREPLLLFMILTIMPTLLSFTSSSLPS